MNVRQTGVAMSGLVVIVFSACSSSAGRGAAIGAGSGAIVGGPVGAAVGAGAGALVGAAVDERRATKAKPPPASGYPLAENAGPPNMYFSPYTHKTYDLADVPEGGLVQDADTGGYFRKP